MDLTTGWIEVLAGVASPVFLAVISMFVEALRRPPKPPEKLAWAPGIPIRYVSVGGVKLRYIKAGAGPNLVLLHTLRTQLDIFQKVIPEYPGSSPFTHPTIQGMVIRTFRKRSTTQISSFAWWKGFLMRLIFTT